MRARSPQFAALAVTVVVVGGGATLGWHHWHGSDDNQSAPSSTQPTPADAHQVAQALAKMPSKPQDLIATDVRSAIGTQAKQALPAGATVTANEATWHPDGLGGGTITATVTAPGAPTTVYTVMMIKEPTGWKVVGTVPMTPSAPKEPVAPKPPAGPNPLPPAPTTPAQPPKADTQ
jgi:hypothetical protein